MAATVSFTVWLAVAVVATVLLGWLFVWAYRQETRRHTRWMAVQQAATSRTLEDFYWRVCRADEKLQAQRLRAERIGFAALAQEIAAEADAEYVQAGLDRLLKAVS